MRYQLIISSFMAALTITACSKSQLAPSSLKCDDAPMINDIQRQLQQNISQGAYKFAQSDTRQFIDPDKIIAAASQLSLALNSSQLKTDDKGQNFCSSELTITLPASIIQQTENNTPFIYGKTNFLDLINQQIQPTDIKFTQNTFTQPITYDPIDNASQASQTANPIRHTNLNTMSQVLLTTLLPYGVKDIVLINGQPYNRNDARNLLLNQSISTGSNVPISQEAQAASSILNGHNITDTKSVSKPETQPETQTIITTTETVSTVSDAELQQAIDNSRNATDEMKRLWENLDKTVQSTLQNEQQQWEVSKNKQCNHSSSSGLSREKQLSQLQCDSRLTNQRLNYLRGFSI